ncbi:ribonuclease VapC [Nocardioides baekrokdamisoli]|uniref:Ribonuclease VapC n=1 Tax=Nocardioides baekrokdamisoli TaxID=1804624 RepID=A0A3G9J4J9_9ACTN|nr:type II toxin-antitoxin system VapC family toxin [Nocardioides baekrokdamisoli]BBH17949.1 ribonuclease VapC [Nocardioides baekrokdamisoli]
MYTAYVDSSLLVKVMLEEVESAAVREWVSGNIVLVSSRLLEAEMRRVAARSGIPQADASEALSYVNLVDVPPSAYFGAGIHPDPDLRTLDALHVTVATMIGVDAIATYDVKMAATANAVGLAVITPS